MKRGKNIRHLEYKNYKNIKYKGIGVGHRWTIICLIIAVIALAVIIAFSVGNKNIGKNVAVIPIEGMILTTGSQSFIPYKATYSDEVINYIKEIERNNNIKAIILEINSPGGSAVASSEIAEAIKGAEQKNKTVVALIREQGTSGAYWIASSCDYIIADPLAITGSIGVIASYLEFSGLLERYNVTYEKLTAGKYKDVMSPYRELTPEEKQMIQKKLDMIHEVFIKEVAKNRNLSDDKVRELANGMFYLGKEAKSFGLVDALGTKEDAINYLEKKLGIKIKIKKYKKEKSFLDTISKIQSKQAFWLGRGIGASIVDKSFASLNINV